MHLLAAQYAECGYFLWHNMSSNFAIGISTAQWLVGVVSKIWLNMLRYSWGCMNFNFCN